MTNPENSLTDDQMQTVDSGGTQGGGGDADSTDNAQTLVDAGGDADATDSASGGDADATDSASGGDADATDASS